VGYGALLRGIDLSCTKEENADEKFNTQGMGNNGRGPTFRGKGGRELLKSITVNRNFKGTHIQKKDYTRLCRRETRGFLSCILEVAKFIWVYLGCSRGWDTGKGRMIVLKEKRLLWN